MKKALSWFGRRHWAIKLITVVILAALFIGFVSGINEPHFSPFTFTAEKKLVGVTSFAVSGPVSVISERYQKEILFLDEARSIKRIVDLTKPGSPADLVTRLAIFGDSVYAVATRQNNGGMYIKSESVLKYDKDGNFINEIYRVDHEDGKYIENPVLLDITHDGQQPVIMRADGNSINLIKLDENGSKDPVTLNTLTFEQPVVSGIFSPGTMTALIKTQHNTVYKCNTANGDITPAAENILGEAAAGFDIKVPRPAASENRDNEQYDTSMLHEIGQTLVYLRDSANTGISYALDEIGKGLYVHDENTGETREVKHLRIAPALFVKNLVFWLGAAILAAFIVIGIVSLLKKHLKARSYKVLLLILVFLIVVAFFSLRERNSVLESYKIIIGSSAKLTRDTVSDNFGDRLAENGSKLAEASQAASARTELRRENTEMLDAIQAQLRRICHAQTEDRSLRALVYIPAANGRILCVADSIGRKDMLYMLENWKHISDTALGSPGEIKTVSNLFEEKWSVFYPVTDSKGDTVGIIEVSDNIGNVEQAILSRSLDLTVKLGAILTVIYILIKLLRTFGKDLKQFKELKRKGDGDATLSLYGIFTFAFSIFDRIDTVLLPLIVIEMCVNQPVEQVALLAALPSTLRSVGSILGQLVFVKLVRTFGERRCALTAQCVCIGICLGNAFCVSTGNIPLFLLFNLLYGFVSYGIMSSIRVNIPIKSNNAGARANAYFSESQSIIAAYVFALLAGGYIKQYLSGGFMYVAAAILAIPLLILCFFMFPANKRVGNRNASMPKVRAAGKKNIFSVLLMPSMLILLGCYILPLLLINGYNGYLFPIYADTVGLSAVILSCLNVFSKTITFVLNEPIEQTIRKHDRTKMAVGVFAFCCLCLILAIISQNIIWAVVTFFVSEIAYRICKNCASTFKTDAILSSGADKNMATQACGMAYGGIDAASRPLISLAVPLGFFPAAAITGGVSAVLVSLFALFQRKHKNKTDESDRS